MTRSCGARIHPTRSPPQNVLDAESTSSALSSNEPNDGGSTTSSRLTSRSDSSMTARVPARFIARASAPRDDSLITADVGLWKSGIRYAARCRPDASMATAVSTSHGPSATTGSGVSLAPAEAKASWAYG